MNNLVPLSRKQPMILHAALILFLLIGPGIPASAEESFDELSLDQLERGAMRGDADAQFALGLRYFQGDGDAEKDLQLAFRWFNASAERGHIEANRALVTCHSNGMGVEQNSEKAGDILGKISKLSKAAKKREEIQQKRDIDSYIASLGPSLSRNELLAINHWQALDAAIGYRGLDQVVDWEIEQRNQDRVHAVELVYQEYDQRVDRWNELIEIRIMSQKEIDASIRDMHLRREARSKLVEAIPPVNDQKFLRAFYQRTSILPVDFHNVEAYSTYGWHSIEHLKARLIRMRVAADLKVSGYSAYWLNEARDKFQTFDEVQIIRDRKVVLSSTETQELLVLTALLALESEQLGKRLQTRALKPSDVSELNRILRYCNQAILRSKVGSDEKQTVRNPSGESVNAAFSQALRVAYSFKQHFQE
ncbi:MAG: hypothetical protein AAGJ40_23785 [Planctomycetota bacterium]